jgi:hypothetical protein
LNQNSKVLSVTDLVFIAVLLGIVMKSVKSALKSVPEEQGTGDCDWEFNTVEKIKNNNKIPLTK